MLCLSLKLIGGKNEANSRLAGFNESVTICSGLQNYFLHVLELAKQAYNTHILLILQIPECNGTAFALACQ